MISFPALKALLNSHVCEVRFLRRREKIGAPASRKALITNCGALLTTPLSRQVLHWRPPRGVGLKYNPDAYGLVVAWDILWQDYRQFDGYTADLLNSFPVITDAERNEFWQTFYDTFLPMTPAEKVAYMNG